MQHAGSRMKMGITHQVNTTTNDALYRSFLALGRKIARRTNSQSTPRSRTQEKKKVSARTDGAGDRCECSRDRKRWSFLKMTTGIMRAPADCKGRNVMTQAPDKRWENGRPCIFFFFFFFPFLFFSFLSFPRQTRDDGSAGR